MEIRYGIVGEIVGGIYAGWYIFIQQYHTGEDVLLLISTPQTQLPNVEGYDTWVQYRAHIVGYLEDWGVTAVIWREDLQSNLPPYGD